MAGENAESAGPPRLRVLIVDDDRALGHSLQLALSRECHVLSARSAAEALRLLAVEPVDAILCDLLLGEENGAILAGKVVAQWPRYQGRVILMTGAMPDPSWADRVTALGHQVLAKPFTRVQAMAALRRIAGG